ncbi:MAG: hypothetical protein PHF45_02180 [Candidatus Pacebacteria bacterium]|nr:hypothetical protein [Candidatus Paceibacterota bacterium]
MKKMEMEEVPNSKGIRRSFSITVSLQEGYGESGVVHPIEEAIKSSMEWMKARASQGLPFITGTFVLGQVVYAWPEGYGKAGGGSEPEIIFQGEISPLYLGNLSDEEAKLLLNNLASELGVALGQTRVYVSYRDETWVLQTQGKKTPTGEEVK